VTAARAPKGRRRRWALNVGVGSFALSLVFVAGGFATDAIAADAFTKTVTIDRTHLVNGADQMVDERTFRVAARHAQERAPQWRFRSLITSTGVPSRNVKFSWNVVARRNAARASGSCVNSQYNPTLERVRWL